MGYLYAFISSMFSSLYIVPKKLSKQKPIYYVMFSGLGFLLISVSVFILRTNFDKNFHENIFNSYMLFASLDGIIWMLASLFAVSAIDMIGLSRANQWKCLQGPIGSILILFFMAEYGQIKLIFVILSALFIFGAAMLFNVRNGINKQNDRKGIIFGLLSAFLFGVCALLEKYIADAGFSSVQHIYIALFIFISSCVYIFIRDKTLKELLKISKIDNILPFCGGIIYYFLSFFVSLAYFHIDGSVAFTINQLSTVWTFLVGVFIFKEINYGKNKFRLTSGIIFAILGILALLLSKK